MKTDRRFGRIVHLPQYAPVTIARRAWTTLGHEDDLHLGWDEPRQRYYTPRATTIIRSVTT